MKLAYRFLTATLSVVFVMGFASTLSAEPNYKNKDFTKTIKKDFPIDADGKVKISNRYGKIDVSTWDRDRVKVEVRITVRASSEARAQEGFERIKINFSDSQSHVSAETEIGEGEKSFWESWTTAWGGKIDFTIDYQINMPASCDLDLKNKYGDSHIASLDGDVNIDVKYGNFELEEAEGDLEVMLGYGNGTIERARNVSAEGKYCNLKVKYADDVSIVSKYSKIKIEEAKAVRTVSKYDSYDITKMVSFKNEGKYDHFDIGTVDEVWVISKYADINVERLATSANFELKYGGARVDDVAKEFTEINLVGKHADYKINVEEGADYQVKATSDSGGINYPSNMQVIFVDENGGIKEVNGYFGKKNAKGIINAQLDYGGLKVW